MHGEGNTAYDDLAVREFLDSDDLTILAVTNRGDKLIFNHQISDDENCLVFYKIPKIGNGLTNQAVNGAGETASVLGILTLEGGIAKSIYNSISRVYSPQVAKVRETYIENEHLFIVR